MPQFITPYSGQAELTAGNGLVVRDQGRWLYSQSGYNDGATFGVSLGWPDRAFTTQYNYGAPPPDRPLTSGLLHLEAQDWTIADIGNALTSYTDPVTHITYADTQCRITVTGRWVVVRAVNSNSFNSIGVAYAGVTQTNLGDITMSPWLLTYVSPEASYVIQGSEVAGGAADTFSGVRFECRCSHDTTSDNSNYEYQSNSIARPSFNYTYTKSWQID